MDYSKEILGQQNFFLKKKKKKKGTRQSGSENEILDDVHQC